MFELSRNSLIYRSPTQSGFFIPCCRNTLCIFCCTPNQREFPAQMRQENEHGVTLCLSYTCNGCHIEWQRINFLCLHFFAVSFFIIIPHNLLQCRRCLWSFFVLRAKVITGSSRRVKVRHFVFCKKSPHLVSLRVVFFEKTLTRLNPAPYSPHKQKTTDATDDAEVKKNVIDYGKQQKNIETKKLPPLWNQHKYLVQTGEVGGNGCSDLRFGSGYFACVGACGISGLSACEIHFTACRRNFSNVYTLHCSFGNCINNFIISTLIYTNMNSTENSINCNGCSVCKAGQENYTTFRPAHRQNTVYYQYDYRHTDGKLFSTVAPTLEGCRQKRDRWLNDNKLNR